MVKSTILEKQVCREHFFGNTSSESRHVLAACNAWRVGHIFFAAAHTTDSGGVEDALHVRCRRSGVPRPKTRATGVGMRSWCLARTFANCPQPKKCKTGHQVRNPPHTNTEGIRFRRNNFSFVCDGGHLPRLVIKKK